MRTVRQQFIARGMIRTLMQAGGILVKEETLLEYVRLFVGSPEVSRTEFEEALRWHDAQAHLTTVDDDFFGRTYAISPQGRAFAAQQRI